jgi:hypothetical protein
MKTKLYSVTIREGKAERLGSQADLMHWALEAATASEAKAQALDILAGMTYREVSEAIMAEAEEGGYKSCRFHQAFRAYEDGFDHDAQVGYANAEGYFRIIAKPEKV